MSQHDYKVWWDKALKCASNKLGITVEELTEELDEVKQHGKCQNPDCDGHAVHKHHIFMGTGRRERSEQFGYHIRLCDECHALSHDTGADTDLTQADYKRKWCAVIGVDYDEALRNINGGKLARAVKSYKVSA
jgi:hypothetical protein